MGTITIQAYRCDRCGHEWAPRQSLSASTVIPLPKVCPKCKSPYWNTPRRRPKIEKIEIEKVKVKKEV